MQEQDKNEINIFGVNIAVTAVITVIISFLGWAYNSWVYIYLEPQKAIHNASIQQFQKERDNSYQNFKQAWGVMRNQYTVCLLNCIKGKHLGQSDFKTNKELVKKTIDSSNGISYYFGDAIKQFIIRSVPGELRQTVH